MGRYLVFSGEYIWKYTHNAYDFSILGATPITFPIEWHNSKIPGFAGRVSVPNFHGFSALMVFSSVAARFFAPQLGGAGATAVGAGRSFPHRPRREVQHDDAPAVPALETWPVDRIQLAIRQRAGCRCGAVRAIGTNPVDLAGSGLTADQEFQAGFICNGVRATPTVALPDSCPASQFTSSLVKIPAPGTENDDHNPPRIAPRHLFDLAVGHDNLFHGDKYKVSLQVTAINVTNKYALYNFLSTFSGTHYVTPANPDGGTGISLLSKMAGEGSEFQRSVSRLVFSWSSWMGTVGFKGQWLNRRRALANRCQTSD